MIVYVIFFYYIIWIYHCLLNHLLIEGHVGCPQFGLPRIELLYPFTYCVRVNTNFHLSGVTAGSHGWCVFSFNRNRQAVFQNGCDILHSPWQCMSASISLHLHQHLKLSLCFPFCHYDRSLVVHHGALICISAKQENSFLIWVTPSTFTCGLVFNWTLDHHVFKNTCHIYSWDGLLFIVERNASIFFT